MFFEKTLTKSVACSKKKNKNKRHTRRRHITKTTRGDLNARRDDTAGTMNLNWRLQVRESATSGRRRHWPPISTQHASAAAPPPSSSSRPPGGDKFRANTLRPPDPSHYTARTHTRQPRPLSRPRRRCVGIPRRIKIMIIMVCFIYIYIYIGIGSLQDAAYTVIGVSMPSSARRLWRGGGLGPTRQTKQSPQTRIRMKIKSNEKTFLLNIRINIPTHLHYTTYLLYNIMLNDNTHSLGPNIFFKWKYSLRSNTTT